MKVDTIYPYMDGAKTLARDWAKAIIPHPRVAKQPQLPSPAPESARLPSSPNSNPGRIFTCPFRLSAGVGLLFTSTRKEPTEKMDTYYPDPCFFLERPGDWTVWNPMENAFDPIGQIGLNPGVCFLLFPYRKGSTYLFREGVSNIRTKRYEFACIHVVGRGDRAAAIYTNGWNKIHNAPHFLSGGSLVLY